MRALRPFVIGRKISGGSRSPQGSAIRCDLERVMNLEKGTATSIMALPDAARLDRLAAAAAAGRLRSPLQRTYPLEQVPQALADFAAGKFGKLAVRVA